MGKMLTNMASTGSLNDRLISELLSASCWANENGTVAHFTVHLCCEAIDIEVHARKGKAHFKEDGTYSHTDFTVTSFTTRVSEDAI